MLVLDLRLMTSGPTGRVDRRRLTLKTRELVAFGSTCIEALFGTLPPVRPGFSSARATREEGVSWVVEGAGSEREVFRKATRAWCRRREKESGERAEVD
jgi:hypothetical protein